MFLIKLGCIAFGAAWSVVLCFGLSFVVPGGFVIAGPIALFAGGWVTGFAARSVCARPLLESLIINPGLWLCPVVWLLADWTIPEGATVSLLFIVSAWAGVVVGLRVRLKRAAPRQGHCATCGYDLTGNTSGRCPECGTPVKANAGGYSIWPGG